MGIFRINFSKCFAVFCLAVIFPNPLNCTEEFGSGSGSWNDDDDFDRDQDTDINDDNIYQTSSNQACNLDLNKLCLPHLKCSTFHGDGVCKCNPGMVYVPDSERCWEIATAENNYNCERNEQCQAGAWGSFSRCNKGAEKEGECDCSEHVTEMDLPNGYGSMAVINVNKTCYLKRNIGDGCEVDRDCQNSIDGETYCKESFNKRNGKSYFGICACYDPKLSSRLHNACLKRASELVDPCEIDEQCRSLGEFAACSRETGKCECSLGDKNTQLIYYPKLAKCVVRKQYNDSCENDDECKASLGPLVICNVTKASPNQKVCYCESGIVCRSCAAATSIYFMTLFCVAFGIGIYTKFVVG